MQANRAWSQRDHEALLKLAGSGCTASEIANRMTERLGFPVSRNAVIGRLHRAGLPLGKRGDVPPSVPQARPARPKPAPKPKAAPKPVVQPVVKRRCDDVATVALLDLQPHHCKWPVGDPGAPGFGFCGDARVEDTPYCAGHNARATTRREEA